MKRLLTFLITFGLILSVLPQDTPLSKVRIDQFDKGQNSNDIADIIQPSQGEKMQNVVLNRKGRLSKRKGQALFVNDMGNTAMTGLGRFDPDSSTSFMITASGTQVLRALSSDVKWTQINSGFSQTTGQDTEFIQANNLLFVINGEDNTDWYNGSVWTTGAGIDESSPPTATTGEWLRNYLFLSGNPNNEDWVYFSNNLDPEVFTQTDIVKINTGDGQKVIYIESFRLNELIIYKQRSIFVLDITGTTPLTDWTVQPITTAVGCLAPRSVINIGNDHWFLSSEPIAVRSLVRSSFDKILVNRVSDPIQDILDGTGDLSINDSDIDKAAAILFDNKYILAVPTGTSTVNNTVLVYDFLVNAWYTIDGWFPAAWVKFDEDRLFYIDANDNRVFECFTGTTGDFPEGPNFIARGSSPTVGISYEYISKNIDFDNPEVFKELDSLEVEFDTTGNYDATAFIDLDNEGFQQVGTVNLAGDVPTLPQTLPFTLTSGGIARNTFPLQQYGEFKKIQVKITQDGLGELVDLSRFSIFGKEKPWRRE